MLTLCSYSCCNCQVWLLAMLPILPISSTLQPYLSTVLWHQLKCLLGYHGLQQAQIMSLLRWELAPNCWCLPVSLEERKMSWQFMLQRNSLLSETFQEFQIQLGDIRKKFKSHFKSPPTFLLFLQSDYCSWSMYQQISQKWAMICLKNIFWSWWSCSFEEWDCSDPVRRAQMLLFLSDISGAKISPRNYSWHRDIWGG